MTLGTKFTLQGWRRTIGVVAVAAFLLAASACVKGAGGDGTSKDAEGGSVTAPTLEGASAVFAAVSPGVPLVKTAAGSGAGLLVDGGYVITSASLVVGGGQILVTFSDGSSVADPPIAAIDVLTGAAALGPVKTTQKPLALADPKSISAGSDLYIIGYAAGQMSPSISRGMLAGSGRWEEANLALLQLDGGGIRFGRPAVVLSASGEAIGIQAVGTTATFALSAAEVNSRIRAMLDPKAGIKSTARLLAGGERRPVQKLDFDGLVTQRLISFQGRAGAPVTLILSGDSAATVVVRDAAGLMVKQGTATAKEKLELTFVPKAAGPYFATVRLGERKTATFELSSDADLALFADPDDLHALKAGQTYQGAIDFAGDTDILLVELVAGQTATVRVSGGLIDPMVELFSDDPKISVADDDSGGGVFGGDAIVQFKAPATGRYALQVSDSQLAATGGYVVSIQGASSDAEIAATASQIRELIASISTDPRGVAAVQEILAAAGSQGGPRLPAAFGAAWRGSAKAGALFTDLATTDTTAGTGAQRSVADPDGRFRVVTTLAARGLASATVVILNAKGETVAGSGVPLTAVCSARLRCLATTAIDVVEPAANGPWTISLDPVEGSIDGWQLEVRRDREDTERASLPAQ